MRRSPSVRRYSSCGPDDSSGVIPRSLGDEESVNYGSLVTSLLGTSNRFLAPLMTPSGAGGLVRPVLDVGLEHPVLEMLFVVHGLGHVVERYDTLQRGPVHHRHVTRVALEHRPAQFHYIERRHRGQRIGLVDIDDPYARERARALGHRRQDLAKSEHAG